MAWHALHCSEAGRLSSLTHENFLRFANNISSLGIRLLPTTDAQSDSAAINQTAFFLLLFAAFFNVLKGQDFRSSSTRPRLGHHA